MKNTKIQNLIIIAILVILSAIATSASAGSFADFKAAQKAKMEAHTIANAVKIEEVKSSQFGPVKIEGEHPSDYNQRFTIFMQEMTEADRALFWHKEQIRRKGEFVNFSDTARICEAFGNKSTQCETITIRHEHQIALGKSFKIECDDKYCNLIVKN